MFLCRWSSGKNITPGAFNKFLREALSSYSGYPGGIGVTSHCFRAGVTSMLGQMGASPDLIQGVGRWNSDAWKTYCRLGRSTRLEDYMAINRMTSTFEGFKSVQIVEALE